MKITELLTESAKKGLYYYVNKRKKAGTSRSKNNPKAPSEQDWKNAAKTAKNEGGNPRQAAIAIAKRESGKYNKDGERIKEELSLDQQFDLIEEMVETIAEQHGIDSALVWEDFESLNDDDLCTLSEDWQKVNKRDKTDGMSRKAVKAYRRENPGSKLKTAVTTKPSKLKKGGKASKRRKSFCARMSGMKRAHAGAKTKRDPDSPINKALRRWNC
jgi:hypothetical protein